MGKLETFMPKVHSSFTILSPGMNETKFRFLKWSTKKH